jgi:hypothetical protein
MDVMSRCRLFRSSWFTTSAATVSETIANAFEKKKALPEEGSLMVLRDIAGARFVSRYDPTRIREIVRHPS